MNTQAQHVRPLEIAKSLYRVMQNPDDTSEVFRMFDAATKGPSAFTRKFEKSRAGAALLEGRPDILPRLRDKKALAALPEGSLGRAYLDFMSRDGLTPDWLVNASETAAVYHGDAPHEFVARRMRDTHDLWHVVTGYGGDLLGEASLLAFTYAQTFAPAVGLLVSVAFLRADDPDARHLILDAFTRGLSAAWMPVVAWEDLLARPLSEVRDRLRVGAPRTYEPFYSKDLPPGGLFAKAA